MLINYSKLADNLRKSIKAFIFFFVVTIVLFIVDTKGKLKAVKWTMFGISMFILIVNIIMYSVYKINDIVDSVV